MIYLWVVLWVSTFHISSLPSNILLPPAISASSTHGVLIPGAPGLPQLCPLLICPLVSFLCLMIFLPEFLPFKILSSLQSPAYIHSWSPSPLKCEDDSHLSGGLEVRQRKCLMQCLMGRRHSMTSIGYCCYGIVMTRIIISSNQNHHHH